jgi:hypothetical protein
MERSTRRALGLGGVLLVVGLAAVGAGAPSEGGPLALAGLLATIYGIHRFGRLGPDEIDAGSSADRYAATDAMWVGALAIIAGLSFVIGGGGGNGAYAVLFAGAIAFAWGSRANRGVSTAKPAQAEPAADDDEDRPKPARKRARRKAAGD